MLVINICASVFWQNVQERPRSLSVCGFNCGVVLWPLFGLKLCLFEAFPGSRMCELSHARLIGNMYQVSHDGFCLKSQLRLAKDYQQAIFFEFFLIIFKKLFYFISNGHLLSSRTYSYNFAIF